MNPPLSILRSVISPYGARLLKKPERAERNIIRLIPPAVEKPQGTILAPSWYNPSLTPPLGHDFKYSDYFFYYGSGFAGSNWSCCRACLTTLWGDMERRLHESEHPRCRKAIFEALKKLRADKKCAICDTSTQVIMCGVYLCCTSCQSIWLLDEKQGRFNLEHALRLIGFTGADE